MKLKNIIEEATLLLSSVIEDKAEVKSNIFFMLSYLLNKSISELKINLDLNISKEKEKTFENWLKRRLNFEPVQYITKETEFYGIPIKLDNKVLIPRKETETLVDEVLKEIKKSKTYKVLDLACGTGCIGIAILKNTVKTNLDFSDFYSAPIKITKENLKSLNLESRSKVIKSDMFKNIETKYDIIVSNPPYIKKSEFKILSLDIINFEPKNALIGGSDGLEFYKKIATNAFKYLKEKGKIFLEIGYNQESEVFKIFKNKNWKDINIIKDLSNNPRILIAKTPYSL
jgi:release factor glutamine methyltransferase